MLLIMVSDKLAGGPSWDAGGIGKGREGKAEDYRVW